MEIHPSGYTGRVEVLEGPTGRRSWTEEKKAQIVAESFSPGASVNVVARRHGMQPQHLSTWRRLAREGKIVLPHEADLPDFAPVVIDEAMGGPFEEEPMASSVSDPIEIIIDGMTVRVPSSIRADRLSEIIVALCAAR